MASTEEKTFCDTKVDMDCVMSQSGQQDASGTIYLAPAEERRLVRKIDLQSVNAYCYAQNVNSNTR